MFYYIYGENLEGIRLDLHVHTKYSHDGTMEYAKLVKFAIRRGLQGVAITDHNTIKGAIKARKEIKNFLIIVGSEIRTNKGEIIGLFLEEEVKSRDLIEVIDEIKAQDGIVIVPHPFDKIRSSTFTPSEKETKLIDGIEVFNSRCIFSKYNLMAFEFAKLYSLPMTAGSDAHFANEIGLAGVIANSNDEEEIRRDILRREVRIFGKKSFILNHGSTKVIKLWRKLRKSGLQS